MSTNCPRCGVLLNVNLIASDTPEQEVKWLIRHPGRAYRIECASFDEAMDEWFEGFNVPMKIVNGVPESFEDSYRRVKDYFKSKDRS